MKIDDECVSVDPKEIGVDPRLAIFEVDPALRDRIAESMRAAGFDPSKPIVVWRGRNLVVDGHTRRAAAITAGLDVLVHFADFEDEDEAIDYAVRCQKDRRNLTPEGLYAAILAVDQRRKRGGDRRSEAARELAQFPPRRELKSAPTHHGTAEETAAVVGVSASTVERVRAIADLAASGDPSEREALLSGDKSIKAAAEAATAKKKVRKGNGAARPKSSLKPPFPYFGGKWRAADIVWDRLGDPDNSIEPCCGSAAVTLARPTPSGPRIETINDMDCYVANFWRATQSPKGRRKLARHMVAYYADWPVNEADLHARHQWLLNSEEAVRFRERIKSDPFYFDYRFAGWWVWGACTWIGSGWCPSPADESEAANEPAEKLPRLTGGRTGDLYYGGLGVHADQPPAFLRPSKKRPPLCCGNTRYGLGVHRKPDLSIPNGRPQLADAYSRGRGVHGHDRAETCRERLEWLEALFCALRDRLRTVRVCCGDWIRVCGSKSVTTRLGLTGIFFDPPYGEESGRRSNLYGVDSLKVAADVRRYCLKHGADPMFRIVLAGLEGEHDELLNHGWTVEGWKNPGGYNNRTEEGKERARRERLWCSPYCLRPQTR
jgi:hypothetical protein